MKLMLLAKGLWGHVDGSETIGEDATLGQRADFKRKARRAFSSIVMAMDTSRLYLITSCEKANNAWSTLRDHFERDTLANKLLVKKNSIFEWKWERVRRLRVI